MNKSALYIMHLTCLFCTCNAQSAFSQTTEKALLHKLDTQQTVADRKKNTPAYRILSSRQTCSLLWTGKAFSGTDNDKADTRLAKAVVKGLNSEWLQHSLKMAIKEVQVLEDSVKQTAVTIIALKSAETKWCINSVDTEYFLLDDFKSPIHAIPYFIDGNAYIVCIIPPCFIVGNEVRPYIDRKSLFENILKPLIDSLIP